jgi:NDP-sugar pyrophosphorylase family protein
MPENMGKFNAMILSAGFGERLRPLTEHIPKPLIPLCGKPLIISIAAKIIKAGAGRIAVNIHHKPEEIKSALKSGLPRKIVFFREREILGTGGGILNCKDFLSKTNFFLIHNGDILSDAKLPELIEAHLRGGAVGTLLLANACENKILMDTRKRIRGIKNFCGESPRPGGKLLTYTGIAVFNRSVFDCFPAEVHKFPLINVFKKIIECGNSFLQGHVLESYWRDIGTLEKYFQTHEDIFLRHSFTPDWAKIKGSRFSASKLKISADAKIVGFLDAGKNCEIRKRAILENCILLDGARIAEDSFRKDEIIAPNFSVHRDIPALMRLAIMKDCDFRRISVSSLAEQGSSRKFYRITGKRKTKVLMLSSSDDPDFERFIKIGGYLASLGLGVPKIYGFNASEYSVLMEDLGSLTLNKALPQGNKKLSLYKKTIQWLVSFQNKTQGSAKKKVNREFDFGGLRWESNYFKENFLAKFAKIDLNRFPELDGEFDLIARDALSQARVLCHRDFQSQNIMIKNGEVRIVDFQGARLGPLAYDLMSLLRDAYAHLEEPEIEELMNYYFEVFSESALGKKLKISSADFAKFASSAWLQRNMQALGAFSFLSLVKGKNFYLKHIPGALRNLRRGIDFYIKTNGGRQIPNLRKIIFYEKFD